jgi:hypothetical protein
MLNTISLLWQFCTESNFLFYVSMVGSHCHVTLSNPSCIVSVCDIIQAGSSMFKCFIFEHFFYVNALLSEAYIYVCTYVNDFHRVSR